MSRHGPHRQDLALVEAVFSHSLFFFFNDTATTEIYTLSLHDALPIFRHLAQAVGFVQESCAGNRWLFTINLRSEEHTSELQSRLHLVCRLLLEKKISPISTLADPAVMWPHTRSARHGKLRAEARAASS